MTRIENEELRIENCNRLVQDWCIVNTDAQIGNVQKEKKFFILNSSFSISHRGATLIELLIFLAILSIVMAAALPMLFSATENRLLQQTISIVEQNGTQIMQNASLRIRHAERILDPAMGTTASVLALQTSSSGSNPTIIGLSSGSIVIIEGTTRELISSTQVAVTDFRVRNTSTSSTRQSVTISFRLSRTIRLQMPHSYAQNFEATFTLLPDDIVTGDTCGCLPPYCNGSDTYTWEVCQDASCLTATTPMECP